MRVQSVVRPTDHAVRRPVIRRALLPVSTTPTAKPDVNWLNRVINGSFLLIALYLSLHFTFAVIDNAIRFSRLETQKLEWQKLHAAEQQEYATLKHALHHSQSNKGLEALVRNKLEWVGKEEILVRIH